MRIDLRPQRGRLLPRSRWRDLGVHPRVLASDAFVRALPGHLMLRDFPASLNELAEVLQTAVRPGAVISHSTAAVVWDLPLPARFENGTGMLRVPAVDLAQLEVTDPVRHADLLAEQELLRSIHLEREDPTPVIPSVRLGLRLGDRLTPPPLHVRVDPAATSTAGVGYAVHRGRGGPPARYGRLTLSTPAETFRELATHLPLWDLVAVADALLQPGLGRAAHTPSALHAVVDAARGCPGTAMARRAVGLVRPDVRSPAETILRLLVTEVGLPEPTPNLLVRDPRTRKARYLDLAWPEAMLGLEYDGDGHRTPRQWRADENRRDELAAQGWTLARTNGADLRNPERVLLRLRDTLEASGLRVPRRSGVVRAVQRIRENPPTLRLDPTPSARKR